jgi:parallel beta-helix repeat protein
MNYLKVILLISIGFSCLFGSDTNTELRQQRTFFSKTYRIGQDEYRTTYSDLPMHYINAEGEFEEIKSGDSEAMSIALEQTDATGLSSSYVQIQRNTGTTYEPNINTYVGNYDFLHYEDAEAYIDSNQNGQYDAGVDSLFDDNWNGLWDDRTGTVIWRCYSEFDDYNLHPPVENGDVEYDSVELYIQINTLETPDAVDFGTLKVRSGMGDITSWSNVASFGSALENTSLDGFLPWPEETTWRYGSGQGVFDDVVDILGGETTTLSLGIYKDDESFSDSSNFYISIFNTYISVEYHVKTVTLSNVNEDAGNDVLPGTYLSLYRPDGRVQVESGDEDGIEVFEDTTYSALTHHYEISNKRHHSWNAQEDYSLLWDGFSMSEALLGTGIQAKFKAQVSVDVSECLNAGIKLLDPWYVQNESNPDPVAWIQPDSYQSIDSLASGGDSKFFENQNYDFDPGFPIYSLKIEALAYEIGDSLGYVFSNWFAQNASGDTLSPDSIFQDESSAETKLVIKSNVDAISPEYHEIQVESGGDLTVSNNHLILRVPSTKFENGVFKKVTVSASTGVNLSGQNAPVGYRQYLISATDDGSISMSYTPIGTGDMADITSSLNSIPAGSQVSMPSESQINLVDPTRFAGSAANPVTLKGAGGAEWHGLRLVVGSSDVTLENLVIEDAVVALWTDEALDALTINNVAVDSALVGFNNLYDYGDDFSLTGAEPTLVEPLYDVRITNSSFTNVAQAAIQIQGYELGNLRIDNCNFTPQTVGQGTAIKAGLFDGIWYTAEEDHEPFDSLQILNNDISGFESGIVLQFNESLISLDWATGAYERVVLQDNEISNCDTGIASSGEMLLFSNHNVIDNCDVGHKLNYADLPFPSQYEYCDKLQYRILNETIVGDGNSIGIYDTNPNLDEPYQTLTTFVGACILANHDTAAFNSYATVFHDNILYDNSTNFVEGFVGYYNCWEDTTNHTIDPQFVDYANGDYRLLITSPAIDAGYVDFDGDGTDYATDTDDQDSDGSRMDVGAFSYPSPHTISSALTISTDTEWYGKYAIEADVTVATGATLTILPGSILEFKYIKEDPTQFVINGDLIADGLPDAPITFTSSATSPAKEDWYAIVLNTTVDDNVTMLDNCIIEYSKYGIWMNGASPDISNNIIRYNSYGMQARSGSYPDVTTNEFSHNTYGTYSYYSSPKYSDNLIELNSSRGMYHNGTCTPHLYNNTIRDNSGYGVYMYNHADVQFGHSGADEKGWNEVIDNSSYGIYASYYCDPFLGTTDPYNTNISIAGYNSIHGNGISAMRMYNYSTAEAEWNWWGSATPDSISANATSSFDITPYLTTAPNPNYLGSSLAKSSEFDGYADCPDYDFFNPDTSSECALWHWAHDLRITNQTPVALWAWELYVRKYPDAERAPAALVKIANYTPLEDHDDLISYLYTILDNNEYGDVLRVKSLELLMGVHIKTGEFQDASSLALSLLDQATCSDQERIALYNLIDLNQFGLGKATAAAGFLQRMKEEYPKDELTLMAAELMGEKVDWAMVQFEDNGEEESQLQIPEKYALRQAYPNPFNPTTTIRYDLPQESQVQLNVYDIAGRLVTTLVSQSQVGGSYEVLWNGMDANGNTLPSGLYLYRLQAGSFVANQKMLLLK